MFKKRKEKKKRDNVAKLEWTMNVGNLSGQAK